MCHESSAVGDMVYASESRHIGRIREYADDEFVGISKTSTCTFRPLFHFRVGYLSYNSALNFFVRT